MGAHVWQPLLVAAIVTAAAVYAVWSLTPATVRSRWARRLGSWGRAQGRAAWMARLTVDIERRAAARADGQRASERKQDDGQRDGGEEATVTEHADAPIQGRRMGRFLLARASCTASCGARANFTA
jgi:hypothetical protein